MRACDSYGSLCGVRAAFVGWARGDAESRGFVLLEPLQEAAWEAPFLRSRGTSFLVSTSPWSCCFFSAPKRLTALVYFRGMRKSTTAEG